ncbi:MAG: hypothetical protein GY761_09045 [Hyphomicrobiales bacterium]|nr:hypothetical protein [Hyphomicrobiales bacterium]
MLTSSHLDKAVAQAIISDEQASALREIARTVPESEQAEGIDFSVSSEDEPFRLLKGFRDFFIAIGIVILAIGLSMLAEDSFQLVIGKNVGRADPGKPSWFASIVLISLVAVSLTISEWVTKSQRLPLSSLVLTLIFAVWMGLFGATTFYSLAISIGLGAENNKSVLDIMLFAGVLFAILALIYYYRRYRLPFVLFPLAIAVILGVTLVFDLLLGLDKSPIASRILIGSCGIGVLIAAMLFDVKDRFRTTRLSECAFWLHLLAAPLIVHSILYDSLEAPNSSILVFLVVLVLAVFALIIDRRAMLVSALIYLGYSLFTIIKDSRYFGEFNISISFVILGAFVLGLGLGWSQIRRFFVNYLVSQAVREKLPPVVD